MARRDCKRTFTWHRIVLHLISMSRVDPFLRLQLSRRLCEEYTWKLPATARAQHAFLWRGNWRSGSQDRVFLPKAHHGRCSFWMRTHSSRSQGRAVGIVEAHSASKNGADICGTDTPLAYLVGVSAGGSPTL